MKEIFVEEKRTQPRYHVRGKLKGHILPGLSPALGSTPPFEVAITDISEGGLSIVSPHLLAVSSPIRCQIRLGRVPVSIPTLAQVRWVGSHSSRTGIRVGLQFLL